MSYTQCFDCLSSFNLCDQGNHFEYIEVQGFKNLVRGGSGSVFSDGSLFSGSDGRRFVINRFGSSNSFSSYASEQPPSFLVLAEGVPYNDSIIYPVGDNYYVFNDKPDPTLPYYVDFSDPIGSIWRFLQKLNGYHLLKITKDGRLSDYVLESSLNFTFDEYVLPAGVNNGYTWIVSWCKQDGPNCDSSKINIRRITITSLTTAKVDLIASIESSESISIFSICFGNSSDSQNTKLFLIVYQKQYGYIEIDTVTFEVDYQMSRLPSIDSNGGPLIAFVVNNTIILTIYSNSIGYNTMYSLGSILKSDYNSILGSGYKYSFPFLVFNSYSYHSNNYFIISVGPDDSNLDPYAFNPVTKQYNKLDYFFATDFMITYSYGVCNGKVTNYFLNISSGTKDYSVACPQKDGFYYQAPNRWLKVPAQCGHMQPPELKKNCPYVRDTINKLVKSTCKKSILKVCKSATIDNPPFLCTRKLNPTVLSMISQANSFAMLALTILTIMATLIFSKFLYPNYIENSND